MIREPYVRWCERVEVKVISFVESTGLKEHFYFTLLDLKQLLKVFLSGKKPRLFDGQAVCRTDKYIQSLSTGGDIF